MAPSRSRPFLFHRLRCHLQTTCLHPCEGVTQVSTGGQISSNDEPLICKSPWRSWKAFSGEKGLDLSLARPLREADLPSIREGVCLMYEGNLIQVVYVEMF